MTSTTHLKGGRLWLPSKVIKVSLGRALFANKDALPEYHWLSTIDSTRNARDSYKFQNRKILRKCETFSKNNTPMRFWKGQRLCWFMSLAHNPALSKQSLADYVLRQWLASRATDSKSKVLSIALRGLGKTPTLFWILLKLSTFDSPISFHPKSMTGWCINLGQMSETRCPCGFLNSSTSSSAWTGWNCNRCTETDNIISSGMDTYG